MSVNPSDVVVFYGDTSPPSLSVIITLEEKQLQGYRLKKFSFAKKEHKSAEVLAVNPRGELPSCQIGKIVLNECMAVCKYLQDSAPKQGTNLEPDDPSLRGVMWQKLCECLWNLPRRCYKNYVRYLWDTPPASIDKQRVEVLRTDFISEIKLWEQYLETKNDASYLVGSQFTLADVIVFPWVMYFVEIGLNLKDKFPRLHQYYSSISQRDSIKAFMSRNPDFWREADERKGVLSDIHEYA